MKNLRGFTIIELLVVGSIIALLTGMLLPAIGKAHEQALYTRSQGNIKQIGAALVSYSAEYADRQVTWCWDNLTAYGGAGAFNPETGQHNTDLTLRHPMMILGYGIDDGGQGNIWRLALRADTIAPYSWESNFGSFRITNASALSRYLNGRFYDPVYYAPKDTAVIASVEKWWDHPAEYVQNSLTGGQKWSSYIMSPAAMFNHTVYARNLVTGMYWTDPMQLTAGFRSPAMSQALHTDLKSHVIEHHWLQNRRKPCNPAFVGGVYDGCTPYFFNASRESNTITLFYDGHVGSIGTGASHDDSLRVARQNGAPNAGLWSVDQPNGGAYGGGSVGGYYMAQALEWDSSSHTIFTINGIRGRDILPR